MSPALVLNHTFLTGVNQQPLEFLRAVVTELQSTLTRIRRARDGAVVYVDPALNSTDVGGLQFVQWANQRLREPAWRDTPGATELVQVLLSLGGIGPFYTALPVDEQPCPTDTQPSCLHVPEWLRGLVLHSGHHVLSGPGRVWLLSHGDGVHLREPEYTVERHGQGSSLPNLRDDREAEAAEQGLSRQGAQSALEVLEAAVRHTKRVRVLEKARDSARGYRAPPTTHLFQAIVHLDRYALALDEGQGLQTAAQAYQLASGVEMSREKSATLKRPLPRSRRTFTLPDGTTELFEMHAKPGEMRVHVYARKERSIPNDPTSEHTIIYIGHCGEHLPLK